MDGVSSHRLKQAIRFIQSKIVHSFKMAVSFYIKNTVQWFGQSKQNFCSFDTLKNFLNDLFEYTFVQRCASGGRL